MEDKDKIFDIPIVQVFEDDETAATDALAAQMMDQIGEQMIAGYKIERTILTDDPYNPGARTLALHLSDGSLFIVKGRFSCERQMPS